MFLCCSFPTRREKRHRLKFCPPPPPPPCTMLARHELTIVPKRVKWFANWSTLIGGVVEDWLTASNPFRHYCEATHYHLLYSLSIGPNWMALGKPAPSDNFVLINQVAQKSLKSFWFTFLCYKMSRMFLFYSRRQKNEDKITCESTPPSPNYIAFRSLRAKTQCMCVVYTARYWRRGEEGGGGGGGVGLSRTCLKPCCPACEKKQRDIVSTKIVCMAQ